MSLSFRRLAALLVVAFGTLSALLFYSGFYGLFFTEAALSAPAFAEQEITREMLTRASMVQVFLGAVSAGLAHYAYREFFQWRQPLAVREMTEENDG